MCLSGRCSQCQHDAIKAGINHHDLAAVTEHQRKPAAQLEPASLRKIANDERAHVFNLKHP